MTPAHAPPVTDSMIRKLNANVAAVLFVFCFLYYVDVFCVVGVPASSRCGGGPSATRTPQSTRAATRAPQIVPWLSYSVPGVTNLAVLTASAGAALYCYLCCMLTDPGRVPDSYVPDEEESAAVVEVKKKGGAARFCQKCQRHCTLCLARHAHWE